MKMGYGKEIKQKEGDTFVLANEISKIKNQINELKKSNKTLLHERATYFQKMSKKDKENKALCSLVDEQTKCIQGLQADVDQLNYKLKEGNEKAEEYYEKLNCVEKELQESQTYCEEEYETLENLYNELKVAFEELQGKNKKLQKALVNRKHLADEYHEELVAEKKEYDVLKSCFEKLKQKHDAIAKQLRSKITQHETAKQELENVTSEYLSLQDGYAKLNEQQSQLNKREIEIFQVLIELSEGIHVLELEGEDIEEIQISVDFYKKWEASNVPFVKSYKDYDIIITPELEDEVRVIIADYDEEAVDENLQTKDALKIEAKDGEKPIMKYCTSKEFTLNRFSKWAFFWFIMVGLGLAVAARYYIVGKIF